MSRMQHEDDSNSESWLSGCFRCLGHQAYSKPILSSEHTYYPSSHISSTQHLHPPRNKVLISKLPWPAGSRQTAAGVPLTQHRYTSASTAQACFFRLRHITHRRSEWILSSWSIPHG
jgi:hypothetical protein